jgi:hypothetical protein
MEGSMKTKNDERGSKRKEKRDSVKWRTREK